MGRRSAWWRPEGCGGDQACQNATLRSLRERFGAWNVFSPTVARLYNGSAALDLAPMTDDVIAAIAVARDVGYRVVPILEVDCGKVVGNANSSADFAPAISALLSLAARHDLDLDGFTLDMICGDLRRAQNTTTRRFVEFVDGLMAGLTVRDPDAEVNWFAHGGYHPDAASPNSARACFSEDTYRCERISWTMEGVRGWVELLKGQAGIGLEPSSTVYFESAALHTLFSSLLKLGVASIGTWGSFEKNDFKEEWAMAMRQYLLGNYSHFLSPPPVRAP